jgi:hypothetical protein
MKSLEYIYRQASGMSRLMKWPLLCGLLVLVSARVALAAGSAYVNNGIVNYTGKQGSPPVIDDTNFVNNSQFIINFTAVQPTPTFFYETSDTLNYTNNGLMMGNTGFQFDDSSTSTGLRTMSASFNNPGTVSCGSATNTGDPYLGELYLFGFYPECYVNATNILVSGTVDVGVDGSIQLTGKNVNLTRSRLTLESGGLNANGANAFGTGVFGLNTNFWDPSEFLGPTFAESAFFPLAPFYLYLPNSTPYYQLDSPTPSNNIIRAVFIEDSSGTNVTYNVYFDTAGLGFGSGNVTVEWTGSYQDVATGNYLKDYLYLNDNYDLGASTNVMLINGYPDNFTFTESTVKLINQTPAPVQFYNNFPAGTITNRYAFANVQLVAGTASTNTIPNLSVTNLPGRVQINASSELNLALAQITGPNYMSVQSTNQFDGSPGAKIQVPYSDINVGVTNGFLTVSNLMTPVIPGCSGNVQAWTTRWLTTSSNLVVMYTNGAIPIATNVITITNDYRVLIVGSQLNPTTVAQVQNLIMHGTNSLVVSDAFNVMNSLSADAQNLTLTENGMARGATSLDGELNVASPDNIYWASSMPNLLNLTNNGAIRLQNLSQFSGSSNSVSATPSVAATATLLEVTGRTNVLAGNKVVVGLPGTLPYYFEINLTNSLANQVKIAPSFDGTMSNLIAAINGGAGAGTAYSASTTPSTQVTAGRLISHAFTVTAITNGSVGNSIGVTLSTPTTNLTWSSSDLVGGVDGYTNVTPTQVPYHNFINNGLLSDQGSQIWTTNFVSGGVISNGLGSFAMTNCSTMFTNGQIVAAGDVTITTGNLMASNLMLEADRSLTLVATNLLTDTGVTNGNVWTVGLASIGYGLSLPFLPAGAVAGGAYGNSLLGTTITLYAPAGENVVNTWAGNDFGVSSAGYTNNMAIGHLILDAQGAAPGTLFTFNGTGASNAIYVDRLELRDFASYIYHNGTNMPALDFNSNLVIYYADAIDDNVGDVSEVINGKNNNHLRWVPTYAGHFSSVNVVYAGATNAVNVALAGSKDIDSDGDGTANATDPTPFFLPSMVNLVVYKTNNPANNMAISWNTIPLATNFVYYSTNVVLTPGMVHLNVYSTNNPANTMVISWNTVSLATNIILFSTNFATWQPLTNFVSPQYPTASTNLMVFDPIVSPGRYYWAVVELPVPTWQLLWSFVSTEPYPGPATNVIRFDPVVYPARHYQVTVSPWLTYPY